jgi:hypothetical protein
VQPAVEAVVYVPADFEEVNMAELTLVIEDPTGRLKEDVRRRAISAAQAVLEHYGVTVEECAAVAAKPFEDLPPGGGHNFFRGMGKVATTWLEADAVVRVICGNDVRLRMVDKPEQPPH